MTPNTRKRVTPRTLRKTAGCRRHPPISRAPSSASLEFPISQPSVVTTGTPLCDWARKWAGTSATRNGAQRRTGARSSAARRIAFGGQNIAIGSLPGVSAKPIFVPTKYADATSSTSAASLERFTVRRPSAWPAGGSANEYLDMSSPTPDDRATHHSQIGGRAIYEGG